MSDTRNNDYICTCQDQMNGISLALTLSVMHVVVYRSSLLPRQQELVKCVLRHEPGRKLIKLKAMYESNLAVNDCRHHYYARHGSQQSARFKG